MHLGDGSKAVQKVGSGAASHLPTTAGRYMHPAILCRLRVSRSAAHWHPAS